MEIISKKTKKFRINLFADFLLNKISRHDSTVIQVIDLGNFWVLKGKTSSTEILDIASIKEEFLTTYNHYFEEGFVFQTIDLLEYGIEIESQKNVKIKLFNSDNCAYSKKQIDKFLEDSSKNVPSEELLNQSFGDSLSFCSNFPHGYSLNQGRTLYYYSKLICYRLSKYHFFESLILEIHDRENENNFKVINPSDLTVDDKLTSCILDSFDFDFVSFNKKIIDEGFLDESLNPLKEFNFIKNCDIRLEIF